MTFGILTQYYPPEMGAPQARLAHLAKQFVRRGHEVTVLTAMPNYPTGRILPGYGGPYSNEVLGGVTIKRCWIYPSNSVRRLPRLASYVSFVASSLAVGAITMPSVDYLLTESPPLFLGVSGYLLNRLSGSRWIFNVSDLWPESAVRLGMIGPGMALRSVSRLEAWCYRNAWLVSGQSRGILSNIKERFPKTSTYYLSNGVDTEVFTPIAERSGICTTFADNNRECVVMYAGLHGIAQGLHQVLEVARRISSELRVRFVFLGDGPEKRALMARARDLSLKNVQFLEPVPHLEIPTALSAADIAFIPLKIDLPGAVPSKLYEAMAVGLPILLTAEGEPASIVRETGAGIVTQPGNINQMESALRKLASDGGCRREYGSNGRRAAIQQFDRSRIADAFISYLEAALSWGLESPPGRVRNVAGFHSETCKPSVGCDDSAQHESRRVLSLRNLIPSKNNK